MSIRRLPPNLMRPIRDEVLKRDGYACQKCSRSTDDEKYDDLVAESGGLFIWSIVRARSRREAEIIFSERNLSADLAPW